MKEEDGEEAGGLNEAVAEVEEVEVGEEIEDH